MLKKFIVIFLLLFMPLISGYSQSIYDLDWEKIEVLKTKSHQATPSLDVFFQLGSLLEKYKLYSEALSVYFRAAHHFPANNFLSMGIARCYFLQGNYSIALEFFMKAENQNREYEVLAISGQIDCWIAMKNFEKAQSLLRSLISKNYLENGQMASVLQKNGITGDDILLKQLTVLYNRKEYAGIKRIALKLKSSFYKNLHCGWSDFYKENYSSALELFNQALSIVPGNLSALDGKRKSIVKILAIKKKRYTTEELKLRAEYSVFLKDYPSALNYYTLLSDMGYRDYSLHMKMGYYAVRTGKIETALVHYKAASRIAPASGDPLEGLLLIYGLIGYESKIQETAKKLIAINPVHPIAIHLLGSYYFRKGELSLCENLYQRTSYQDYYAGLMLAYSKYYRGYTKSAKEIMTELKKNVPLDIQVQRGFDLLSKDSIPDKPSILKNINREHFYVMTALWNKWFSAISEWTPEIKEMILLNAVKFNEKLPVFQFLLSDLYLGKGQYEKAISTLNEYSRWNEDDFYSLMRMGNIYSYAGNYIKATDYYNKAEKTKVHLYSSTLALMKNFLGSGNLNLAFKQAGKLLVMVPKHYEASIVCAQYYYANKEYSKVIPYLKPFSTSTAFSYLGWSYYHLDDMPNATKYSVLTQMSNPFHPNIYELVSKMAAQKIESMEREYYYHPEDYNKKIEYFLLIESNGEMKRGIKFLRKLLNRAFKDYTVNFKLGYYYFLMENYIDANIYLERARIIDEDSNEAREWYSRSCLATNKAHIAEEEAEFLLSKGYRVFDQRMKLAYLSYIKGNKQKSEEYFKGNFAEFSVDKLFEEYLKYFPFDPNAIRNYDNIRMEKLQEKLVKSRYDINPAMELVEIYQKYGMTEKALKILKIVYGLHGTDKKIVLKKLADMYYDNGPKHLALKYVSEYVSLADGEYEKTLYSLKRDMINGDYENALKYAKNLYATYGTVDIAYLLGSVHMALKNYDEAKEIFLKFKTYPGMRLQWGWCEYYRNHLDRARQIFENLSREFPHYKPARDALKILDWYKKFNLGIYATVINYSTPIPNLYVYTMHFNYIQDLDSSFKLTFSSQSSDSTGNTPNDKQREIGFHFAHQINSQYGMKLGTVFLNNRNVQTDTGKIAYVDFSSKAGSRMDTGVGYTRQMYNDLNINQYSLKLGYYHKETSLYHELYGYYSSLDGNDVPLDGLNRRIESTDSMKYSLTWFPKIEGLSLNWFYHGSGRQLNFDSVTSAVFTSSERYGSGTGVYVNYNAGTRFGVFGKWAKDEIIPASGVSYDSTAITGGFQFKW